MGENTGQTAKRAAAKKTAASPVGTREDPMANAHPLVGIAGIAEQVTPGPRTAEEQRAAIEKEYGFVATAAITHDGALAYNVGDLVPAANVKRWNYDGLGLVARRTTKAAAAVLEPDPERTDTAGEPAPGD